MKPSKVVKLFDALEDCLSQPYEPCQIMLKRSRFYEGQAVLQGDFWREWRRIRRHSGRQYRW